MALGGSTNAIIHVIAMARRVGLPLDMARFDAISRQVPVIANITPSGKYLMEDFFYAGGLRALMGQMRDLLDLSCVTVNGRTARRKYRGRQGASARRHPFAARAALSRGRHRGAHRQSGAARLRDEAGRRRQALPASSRQGDRVRELRCDGGRGRPRRSRCHARPCAGAEKRRPERRPRHAGMGPIADSEKAPQSRRARHAAHFRCAHERHQLRRLHPARRAGKLCRRSARLRAEPATRSKSTSPREESICMSATTSCRAGAPPGNRRRRVIRAATARCIRSISARPTKAATSISCKARRRSPSRRYISALTRVCA